MTGVSLLMWGRRFLKEIPFASENVCRSIIRESICLFIERVLYEKANYRSYRRKYIRFHRA